MIPIVLSALISVATATAPLGLDLATDGSYSISMGGKLLLKSGPTVVAVSGSIFRSVRAYQNEEIIVVLAGIVALPQTSATFMPLNLVTCFSLVLTEMLGIWQHDIM
jgi:hypothetical protein